MKTAKSIVRYGITRDIMENSANLSKGVIAGSGVVGMNLGGMSSRAGYATGSFLKSTLQKNKVIKRSYLWQPMLTLTSTTNQ